MHFIRVYSLVDVYGIKALVDLCDRVKLTAFLKLYFIV